MCPATDNDPMFCESYFRGQCSGIVICKVALRNVVLSLLRNDSERITSEVNHYSRPNGLPLLTVHLQSRYSIALVLKETTWGKPFLRFIDFSFNFKRN